MNPFLESHATTLKNVISISRPLYILFTWECCALIACRYFYTLVFLYNSYMYLHTLYNNFRGTWIRHNSIFGVLSLNILQIRSFSASPKRSHIVLVQWQYMACYSLSKVVCLISYPNWSSHRMYFWLVMMTPTGTVLYMIITRGIICPLT